MRVFVTGATGFIGSHIIPELIQAGHHVLGMTRSDAGAEALVAAGAEPHRGALEDPATLRDGAAKAEGVIHCAFDHDFTKFVANCEKDRRNIAAMAEALAGSDRPLVITSGVMMGSIGGAVASEDVTNVDHPHPRKASEEAGRAALDAGINVSVVRLPQVHDTVKQGFVSPLIDVARAKRISGYVGDGTQRWSAGHVSDVARLYRLALEKGEAGARYNAVGEEGIAARAIAEAIGRGLKVPVVSVAPSEAGSHFGFIGAFAGVDMSASSTLTQARLGWTPTGPGLLEDLANMRY